MDRRSCVSDTAAAMRAVWRLAVAVAVAGAATALAADIPPGSQYDELRLERDALLVVAEGCPGGMVPLQWSATEGPHCAAPRPPAIWRAQCCVGAAASASARPAAT